jgi:hypothetical protein
VGIPGRATQRYQPITFGAAPTGPEVAVMQQVRFNLYNVPGPMVTTSEFDTVRAFVAQFVGGPQSLADLDRVRHVLSRRPLACPHLLEREDRLANEEARWCWTLWTWQEQIAAVREGNVAATPTPACNLCGQPTGNFCDGLDGHCGRAICTICEQEFKTCRFCRPPTDGRRAKPRQGARQAMAKAKCRAAPGGGQ